MPVSGESSQSQAVPAPSPSALDWSAFLVFTQLSMSSGIPSSSRSLNSPVQNSITSFSLLQLAGFVLIVIVPFTPISLSIGSIPQQFPNLLLLVTTKFVPTVFKSRKVLIILSSSLFLTLKLVPIVVSFGKPFKLIKPALLSMAT